MNDLTNYEKIDSDFMKVYLSDDCLESLFADSENISGEFFLEGLDIRIAITDRELDEVSAAQELLSAINNGSHEGDCTQQNIEQAKEIYSTFMQAHNHELSHLYQVLALPAFQMVWATRYNLLRFEAAVMLKYFELGGVFEGETHYKILKVLEGQRQELVDEFGQQFNDFADPYEMYITDYRKQYDGISLFFIIEGMAHITSLQLSDAPDEDYLKLMESEDYSAAYNRFDSYLEAVRVDLRWKHLVFCMYVISPVTILILTSNK